MRILQGINTFSYLFVLIMEKDDSQCLPAIPHRYLKNNGASDGTRTRTGIPAQGILSPSCLPFHHQSQPECKDRKNSYISPQKNAFRQKCVLKG